MEGHLVPREKPEEFNNRAALDLESELKVLSELQPKPDPD